MRRTIPLVVPFLLAVLGCNRFIGPIEARKYDRADALGPDGRPYSIEQQELRSHARYAIPADDFRYGPSIGVDRIDPIYSPTPNNR